MNTECQFVVRNFRSIKWLLIREEQYDITLTALRKLFRIDTSLIHLENDMCVRSRFLVCRLETEIARTRLQIDRVAIIEALMTSLTCSQEWEERRATDLKLRWSVEKACRGVCSDDCDDLAEDRMLSF